MRVLSRACTNVPMRPPKGFFSCRSIATLQASGSSSGCSVMTASMREKTSRASRLAQAADSAACTSVSVPAAASGPSSRSISASRVRSPAYTFSTDTTLQGLSFTASNSASVEASAASSAPAAAAAAAASLAGAAGAGSAADASALPPPGGDGGASAAAGIAA
jgi:hypothetical protein